MHLNRVWVQTTLQCLVCSPLGKSRLKLKNGEITKEYDGGVIHILKVLLLTHINKHRKRHYRLQKVSNAFLVFKIIYSQATWSVWNKTT